MVTIGLKVFLNICRTNIVFDVLNAKFLFAKLKMCLIKASKEGYGRCSVITHRHIFWGLKAPCYSWEISGVLSMFFAKQGHLLVLLLVSIYFYGRYPNFLEY